MANPLLQVRDLKIEFALHSHGVIRAVDGVSFDIREGATVALVGESGSGKSVISQAIMGILPNSARITTGEILFDDPQRRGKGYSTTNGNGTCDIAGMDPGSAQMRAIRGGRISTIFQEPMTSLSPLHTVGDQVTEALLLHRDVDHVEARRLVAEMLGMVGFPDPQRGLDTYSFELSGGLRQRAMIAMALVCRPALLIADEPTTALDVTVQAQILSLIKDLQIKLGMTMLLITHDLGVVANMAEEVVVIYHGKVMERGSLTSIFSDPQHPYLRSLMRAVPRIGMKANERLTPIREVKHETGGYLTDREPWPADADAAGPLLQVKNVSKCFGIRKRAFFARAPTFYVQALSDVSFSIERGECLGLVGESGCGKTTLSKIIMRAIEPDAGQVLYNNRGKIESLTSMRDSELIEFRRKIQFIFQDPFSSLNPRMTVYDIVSEPLTIHDVCSRDRRVDIVTALMRHVGLDPRFLSRYPHSFSGGQRQRIGIARALALNPDLLICDEPVSALDVSVQAQILNLLKDLQAELGLTYLFISHNLAVVDYMADRIAVMCAGYLVEVAPREILFRNPVHPYTRGLLAAVPRTDLDQKLDLGALMEGRVSDPAAWPTPFGVDGTEPPELVDLGGGHFVRARRSLLSECKQ